jgi:hypothetical protein
MSSNYLTNPSKDGSFDAGNVDGDAPKSTTEGEQDFGEDLIPKS